MGTDGTGIEFREDRPFHDMVAAFLAATMGTGDVFDPLNPRRFSPNVRSLYTGRQVPFLSIDQEQVHKMALRLQAQGTRTMLCCLLANAAYEAVKKGLPHAPEAELLRHVRNAASHGNVFHFAEREPRRPAAWRGIMLDVTARGARNPLFGRRCFPDIVGDADLIHLLWDVEQLLP